MREAGETSKADVRLIGIPGCIRLIRKSRLRYEDGGGDSIGLERAISLAIDELNRVGR